MTMQTTTPIEMNTNSSMTSLSMQPVQKQDSLKSQQLYPQQTLGSLCNEILTSLEPVFSHINRQAEAIGTLLEIPLEALQSTNLSTNREPSLVLQPRHRREGFDYSQTVSHDGNVFFKKIFYLSAAVLFGYENRKVTELRLKEETFVKEINRCAQQLRAAVPPAVKLSQALYSLMGHIVGLSYSTPQAVDGKKTWIEEKQGHACLRAASRLRASMKHYRVRLLLLTSATFLSALAGYSMLFKLGCLASVVYTIFMFIMYTKQIFDIKSEVSLLNDSITLAKNTSAEDETQI